MIRDLTITTDTATICLFDPTALQHRKDDVGDWWSIPRWRLEEMNRGNVLFAEVGSDGTYLVDVAMVGDVGPDAYQIRIPSGRLFVGPGEETSGGGFEPDGAWGGGFVDLQPGNYGCRIRLSGDRLSFELSPGGEGRNALAEPILL